jgi:hypothetical protein
MGITMVTRFHPGWFCGPDGKQTFTASAKPGVGARILAGATCSDCGQLFNEGERVSAKLVEDWNAAQWRHEDNCPDL